MDIWGAYCRDEFESAGEAGSGRVWLGCGYGCWAADGPEGGKGCEWKELGRVAEAIS